mmetsp:Transcript_1240/g.1878  ORF Transcript_1240/g.1878 Transcript_1240/m.1878 type:complete len:97 (+) Transcript_1240:179-469(+)
MLNALDIDEMKHAIHRQQAEEGTQEKDIENMISQTAYMENQINEKQQDHLTLIKQKTIALNRDTTQTLDKLKALKEKLAREVAHLQQWSNDIEFKS